MLNKTNEKAIGCTYVKRDEVISVGSLRKKGFEIDTNTTEW